MNDGADDEGAQITVSLDHLGRIRHRLRELENREPVVKLTDDLLGMTRQAMKDLQFEAGEIARQLGAMMHPERLI